MIDATQLFGGLGFLGIVLAFQSNNRKRILQSLVFGQLMFVVHFVLLDALTAAAINGLAAIRGVCYYYKTQGKHNPRMPLFFSLLFCLAAYLTYDGWISLLPLGAVLLETYALYKDNPRIIRYLMFGVQLPWLEYNFLVGSMMGVMTVVFVMLSLIAGMIRYDWYHLMRWGKNK